MEAHIIETLNELSKALGRIEGKINNGLSENIRDTKIKVDDLHIKLTEHIADENSHLTGIKKAIMVLGIIATIATSIIGAIKFFESESMEKAVTTAINKSK